MPQTQAKQKRKTLKVALQSSTGAFSPFMFGMLMGVAAFSTMMRYQAEKDLKNLTKVRSEIEQTQADDVKRALENAILTENVNEPGSKYSQDLNLDRAKSFLTGSAGKTRSGQNVVLRGRNSGETLDTNTQRVVITASEDEFLRERVQSLGSTDAINELEVSEEQSLAVFDTASIRAQQVKQSKEYLRMEEAQLYRYWGSNNYKFPSGQGDYEDNVNAYTRLRDAWGQNFDYQRISDNKCKLSFTTPWGLSNSVTLKMD